MANAKINTDDIASSKKPEMKNIEAIYALSPMQEGMLFHTQISNDSGIYLMQDRYQIHGEIDVKAYAQAWQKVINMHPALRTSFAWKSTKKPVQIVHRENQIPFETLDWRQIGKQKQEEKILTMLADERNSGFDMSKPQLIRFRLIRLENERYEFIRSFHHILMDAWCISLVTMDFLRFYEAISHSQTLELPSPRPYRDYIQWLKQQDVTKTEAFWRNILHGFQQPTPLMIDKLTSGTTHAPQSVDNIIMRLTKAETQSINQLTRCTELTVNTFIQGAWSYLLSLYSGQQDIVFGVTVSGRPSQMADVENIIGLFINTLPLRVNVDLNINLIPWLKSILRSNLQQRLFEHTPLVDIQQWSETPKGTALFDSLIVFENAPVDIVLKEQSFSFSIGNMEHRVHTNYPLTVVVMPEKEMSVQITYDEDRFNRTSVNRMLEHLMALLRQMINHPELRLGDLNPLPVNEQQQLFEQWAYSKHNVPVNDSFVTHFETQVTLQPNCCAARYGDYTLNYLQLNAKANRIAHALRHCGVLPDQPIALYGERNLNYLLMILGVLKSGAAFVPLDIHHPNNRLQQILQQSDATLLLASHEPTNITELAPTITTVFLDQLLDYSTDSNPRPITTQLQLAYVIYTSGSTGTPKGVMVQHSGMLNNILGKKPALAIDQHDIIAQTASPCFDISIWQFLAALAFGAQVDIVPDDIAKDPYRLAETVEKKRITLLEVVPALMPGLIEAQKDFSHLRWLLPTGEALPATLCEAWFNIYPQVPLMNAYGPAECSDDVAFYPLYKAPTHTQTTVAIGHPTANNQLYVLNTQQQIVPTGVVGEIAIAGLGVGRGYQGNPRRTASSFIPNPWSAQGERLYLSGDLGRWRDNGVLEYVGRRDQQVKIRGHRIELGEIEALLEQLPEISRAVVLTAADARGDQHLLGYVESTHKDTALFKEQLAQRLPIYMVPQAIAVLDALPLNANGKVDRNALPAMNQILCTQELNNTYVAPITELEQQLADIWQEILHCENVGRTDNFFELGGHSLLATQVLARVRQQLNIELSLKTVFESTTIMALADAIEVAQANSTNDDTQIDIPRVSREQPLPLSFAQQRLWFLDQLEGSSNAYNIVNALNIVGQLNTQALQYSIDVVVARHEILRTRFTTINNGDSEPRQHIDADSTISLHIKQIDSQNNTQWQHACEQELKTTLNTPFNLEQGPLLHIALLRNQHKPEQALLIVSMHHIIADGWSLGLLVNEICEAYFGFLQSSTASLPELSIQYADFASWQRRTLQGEILNKLQQFWRKQLHKLPTVHSLPLDFTRPTKQRFRGNTITVQANPVLTQQLNQLARANNATLFMVLQTGFAILQARYSGSDDIVVGTPVANRPYAQLNELIGFFVNTVVLRNHINGNPHFVELLAATRQMTLETFEHQAMPFELLVEELRPARSLSHSPLFQILFSLQNNRHQDIQIPELEITRQTLPGSHAKYDLTLDISESEQGLHIHWEYDTDLFSQQRIDDLSTNYLQLLSAIVESPSIGVRQLQLISPEQLHHLRHWSHQSITPQSNTHSWLTRIEQNMLQQPDAPAFICGDQVLSYAQLDTLSKQLAISLRAQYTDHSKSQEVCIGVHLNRNQQLPITLLAIARAGFSYLPLDPHHPRQRLTMILDKANTTLVITHSQHRDEISLPDDQVLCIDSFFEHLTQTTTQALPAITPHMLAYTLFTSGSTGQPKGVQISHGALSNFLMSMDKQLNVDGKDHWLALTTVAFDISGLELYLPLMQGACITLATTEQASNPQAIKHLITEHSISVMQATPATWRMLVSDSWPGKADQSTHDLTILCGGEALPFDLAQHLHPTSCALWNLYGPTETTIWSTAREITADELSNVNSKSTPSALSIGNPIANTQLYVLDQWQQIVPVGVVGELHIGGDGLARGYINQPKRCALQFIPNPFHSNPGQDNRLYKTGDLVRYQPDGTLAFLGRIDHQVKIRGFRIELGDIENCLLQHAQIEHAVVLARKNNHDTTDDDIYLVAFISLSEQAHSTSDSADHLNEIQRSLAQQLPHYMLPNYWQVLDTFPLTPNGKVDQQQLVNAPLQLQERQQQLPISIMEKRIATIWAQLLKIEPIYRHDNFFTLGGHSLLATQLHSRLRDQFDYSLSLAELFGAQTLADLANLIKQDKNPNKQKTIQSPLQPALRNQPLPLSHAQQRMWILEQLQPGQTFNNITSCLALTGELDIHALQQSIDQLIMRHEGLRTVFVTKEQVSLSATVVQEFIESVSFPINQQILNVNNSEQWRQHIQKMVVEENDKIFELNKAPLIRIKLYSDNCLQQHAIILTLHHIIADGISLNILIRDLSVLYKHQLDRTTGSLNNSPALAPLPIQYADFSVWQRNYLRGEYLEQQLNYWRDLLGDNPSYLLSLPCDRARPTQPSHRANSIEFKLDQVLSNKLSVLAKQSKVTLFTWLMSGLTILLHRYNNENDIRIGTPVANRNHLLTEDVVGCFVNTLVIRTDLADKPNIATLLKRTSRAVIDALNHQDVPFEQVVDAISPPRELSYNPLFQVFFSMEENRLQHFDMPKLSYQNLSQPTQNINFDIALTMSQEKTSLDKMQLSGSLVYSCDLFEHTTAQQWVTHLKQIYEELVQAFEHKQEHHLIDNLAFLTRNEKAQLINQWNDTHCEFASSQPLQVSIEQQANNHPESLAVVQSNSASHRCELTYQQLDQRANQLAHWLLDCGIDKRHPVGLCMNRTPDLLVALLAILKTGASYVPLDPEYPTARIKLTIEQANIEYTLTETAVKTVLPDSCTKLFIDQQHRYTLYPLTKPEIIVHARQLAYVIFTSGSTGIPKGVAIEHRSAQNFLQAMNKHLKMSEISETNQYWLAVTSIAFDISLLELLLPLQQGACVVLANRDDARNPHRLQTLIDQYNVSYMQATPVTWKMLLDNDCPSYPNLIAISGGESLPAKLADTLLTKVKQLWNLYGPTETTVWSSIYSVEPSEHHIISIGSALDNNRLYVLDTQLNPVPLGVAGTLYIGGESLARGYWQQASLSAQQFIPDPFSSATGARMYCTGDIVCRRSNGLLDYLNRIDQQVKINGHRIELGDIENHIYRNPNIKDVVVVSIAEENHYRLIAYIVINSDIFDENSLRSQLRQSIPDYMIPAQFIVLPKLPLTQNEKIDRNALPTPKFSSKNTHYVAATTDNQLMLVNLLKELLNNSNNIGINDNFFALGGDSISAVQLVTKLNTLGWSLTPRDMFVHQTVFDLAKVLDETPHLLPLTTVQQGLLDTELAHIMYWRCFTSEQTQSKDYWQWLVKELCNVHPVLRTCFVKSSSGEIQQCFNNDPNLVQLPYEDLSLPQNTSSTNDVMDNPVQFIITTQAQKFFVGLSSLIADQYSWQVLSEDIQQLTDHDQNGKESTINTPPSFIDWLNTANQQTHLQWPNLKINDSNDWAQYTTQAENFSADEKKQLDNNKLSIHEAAVTALMWKLSVDNNELWPLAVEHIGRTNPVQSLNWSYSMGPYAYPINILPALRNVNIQIPDVLEHAKVSLRNPEQDTTANKCASTYLSVENSNNCLEPLGAQFPQHSYPLWLKLIIKHESLYWSWHYRTDIYHHDDIVKWAKACVDGWQSVLEHLHDNDKNTLSASDFPLAKLLDNRALANVMAQLQQSTDDNDDVNESIEENSL